MTLPRRTSMMVLSLAVITPMTLTGCVSITTSKPTAPPQEQPAKPVEETAAEPVVEPVPVIPAAVTPEPMSAEAGHTVAPGDTLAAIAAAYGWGTAEELAAANGITDMNLIFVGQVIQPPAAPAATVVVLPDIAADVVEVAPAPVLADPPATTPPAEHPKAPVVEKKPSKPKPAPAPERIKEESPASAPTPAPVLDEPAEEPAPEEVIPPVAEDPVVTIPVQPEPVELLPELPADVFHAELLVLVNDYRIAAGVAPLQWDAGSSEAASVWAAMTCEAIMNFGAGGYAVDPSWAGTQLIAVNSTPTTVLAALQSNPEHNAALLDPTLTSLGLGHAVLPADSTYGPQLVAVLNLSAAAHMVDNEPLNEETP